MTSSTKPRSATKDSKQGRIPGEAGIWIFVLGDMSLFALLFGAFMYSRARNPQVFAAAHEHLNTTIGTVNTLLLLTSSLLVALAVQRGTARPAIADRGSFRVVATLFAGALACGLLFVVLKGLEWGLLFADGFSASSNEYFSYYFMLTGTHLIHVLVGAVVLVRLVLVGRRPRFSRQNKTLFETGGIFWHMVDLLWVVLFALFYLIR